MPLSKKQIEIERIKFEKWLSDGGNGFAFNAWLACRESIEIELPDLSIFEDTDAYQYNHGILVTKRKIEAQGFKVKS